MMISSKTLQYIYLDALRSNTLSCLSVVRYDRSGFVLFFQIDVNSCSFLCGSSLVIIKRKTFLKIIIMNSTTSNTMWIATKPEKIVSFGTCTKIVCSNSSVELSKEERRELWYTAQDIRNFRNTCDIKREDALLKHHVRVLYAKGLSELYEFLLEYDYPVAQEPLTTYCIENSKDAVADAIAVAEEVYNEVQGINGKKSKKRISMKAIAKQISLPYKGLASISSSASDLLQEVARSA